MQIFRRVHLVGALALLALGASGCDQTLKIKDGLIPNEFLSEIQPLLGTYRGQMERMAMTMEARLDGNRLVLAPGADLINPACQSRVGNLKEVAYGEKDGKVVINRAVFEFDPHFCVDQVRGRELVLRKIAPNDHPTFKVQYLDYVEWRSHCHTEVDRWGHPRTICRDEPENIYNTGVFEKL